MKFRTVIAAMAATASLMAVSGAASAAPYKLVGWYQRSSSGTLSALMFKSGTAQGCPTTGIAQPCYNPANAATAAAATAVSTAGLATWDWDGTTMTGTGLLWATSTIGSNPMATPVIADKVTNLTINTVTQAVTAATYECVEGTFLATVGADGCLNVNLGGDFALQSSAVYNVGSNPNCVQRTLAGDDVSTGNTRTLTNTAGGGGCDAGDGAFNNWVVVPNARFLILSNNATIVAAAGNCYMFGRAGNGTPSTNPCAGDATLSGVSYMIFAPDVDTDLDGVIDALDNCKNVSNATQVDSDADGFGNRCDGDLGPGTGNNFTNATDTTLFKAQLGQPSAAPTYNKADINANGFVNAQDTTLFKALLGNAPGPSGLCNATFPCPANP